MQSIGPRLTDIVNPNILNTGAIVPPYLTANPTIWKAPIRSVPSVWSTTAAAITTCPLPQDTSNGETTAPVGPYLMHPASYWISPNTPSATLTDFEDAALYSHFPRIAICYDTIPQAYGSIWGSFPSLAQWSVLTPRGHMRNQKGHEAAVAWRDAVDSLDCCRWSPSGDGFLFLLCYPLFCDGLTSRVWCPFEQRTLNLKL